MIFTVVRPKPPPDFSICYYGTKIAVTSDLIRPLEYPELYYTNLAAEYGSGSTIEVIEDTPKITNLA